MSEADAEEKDGMKILAYTAVAVAVAAALTIGPVFWAQACIAVAVWAWRVGLVSEGFAPSLGRSLLAFPFMLLGTAALAVLWWKRPWCENRAK
jgi:hypothetical protein